MEFGRRCIENDQSPPESSDTLCPRQEGLQTGAGHRRSLMFVNAGAPRLQKNGANDVRES
jgi:hypothetical protein